MHADLSLRRARETPSSVALKGKAKRFNIAFNKRQIVQERAVKKTTGTESGKDTEQARSVRSAPVAKSVTSKEERGWAGEQLGKPRFGDKRTEEDEGEDGGKDEGVEEGANDGGGNRDDSGQRERDNLEERRERAEQGALDSSQRWAKRVSISGEEKEGEKTHEATFAALRGPLSQPFEKTHEATFAALTVLSQPFEPPPPKEEARVTDRHKGWGKALATTAMGVEGRLTDGGGGGGFMAANEVTEYQRAKGVKHIEEVGDQEEQGEGEDTTFDWRAAIRKSEEFAML